MSSFWVAFEAFHFLRPLWLLAALPLAVIWWRIRHIAHRHHPNPGAAIAPHLRAALTNKPIRRQHMQPVDLIAATLLCLILGTAGPTWSRVPDPFVAQSAPLVVALKVTDSMMATDIAPSRLERAKQKIRDLMELREGAQTGLIAYAGSAHITVPLTEDPGVMLPYLTGLAPEIMPKPGNRAADAVQMAQELLPQENMSGAVLLVTDTLDPADIAVMEAAGVIVLAMLPDPQADRGIAGLSDQKVISVTPDGGDVAQIDRMLDAAYAKSLLENEQQPWLDRASWLAWPGAILMLFWFRRGWVIRWNAAVAGLLFLLSPQPGQAEGVIDWFLTSDQQGQIAYNRHHFDRAAEQFVDPLWRGYALYRDGQYAKAVEVLMRVDTAEASFIQGMAYLKSQSYREGVRAFETTLDRDPEYPGAKENLKTAQEILAYIERAREESDTGEDGGIGADEVVYDNEAKKGAETQIKAKDDGKAPVILSEAEWLNTVDTQTSDFLRSRFLLEAAQQDKLTETDAIDEGAAE